MKKTARVFLKKVKKKKFRLGIEINKKIITINVNEAIRPFLRNSSFIRTINGDLVLDKIFLVKKQSA